MISLFGGVLLGLSLAAPPGPVNAIIAEQATRIGFNQGFLCGLAAVLVDGLFCLLVALGMIPYLHRIPELEAGIFLAGSLLLLWFGADLVRSESTLETLHPRAGIGKSFLVSLTNPYQIGWWLTAGASMLLGPGGVEGTLLLVGFFLGLLVWILGFPALLIGLGKRFRTVERWIPRLSALVMVAFGIGFLMEAVRLGSSLVSG